MATRRKTSLLTVLIALAVASVVIGFSNALFAGYLVQKAQVITTVLDSNRAYAEKLAEVIDLYVDAQHRQLQAAVPRLAEMPTVPSSGDLSPIIGPAQGVSAVLLADAVGTITARFGPTPTPLAAVDTLAALGVNQLRAGEWVMPCCLANTAFGALTLVEPIMGPAATPKGFVAAVVILERGSRLDRLVGRHAYADGTSVYLVNVAGQVLYHHGDGGPDAGLIASLRAALAPGAPSGAVDLQDASGSRMLVGYAAMTRGKWAVVVQRPLDQALSPVKTLLGESLRFAIPAVGLTLLLVCVLAYAIARPLARLARAMDSAGAVSQDGARALSMRTWYFEADRLRQALAATVAQHRQEVGRLNTESMTDPMTGLRNRRAMRQRIDMLVAAGSPFAVIALDLDHFKQINDTHGHPAGDQVLIAVARALEEDVRQQDSPFRVGGEEFVVLVPVSSATAARLAAERLRKRVAGAAMPPGVGPVTVSVGVALWPQQGASPQAVIQRADQALYQSKQAGRDRVTLWQLDPSPNTDPA